MEDYREVLPQPQMGTMDSQNLEVTKYLTENEVFKYDDEGGEVDEHNRKILRGDIPSKIKNRYWAFLCKDAVLTNNAEKDVFKIMNRLESAIDSNEMAMEPGEYTWDYFHELDNLREMVENKAKRAKNMKERQLLSSQITQTLYGSAHEGDAKKPGWFGRFFGKPEI